MGDKTEVLEALLPALFYMTLKPTWLYESPWSSICQGKDPDFCVWCVLSDKVLGAKSRALARIRLAEGIGQHRRYAKPHNRKLPRLLVGSLPWEETGQSPGGAEYHEAWQLQKRERQGLGRVQVVRVHSEVALGSSADWLQAPWPVGKGQGQSGKAQRARWGTPGAAPCLTLH